MVFRLLEPVSLKHDNPADRPTQTPCHSFFSLASVGIRSPDPGGFSLNSEVMTPSPSLYACAGCTRSLTEVTLPRFRFVCQELPSRLWQSWSQLLNFLKFSVSRPWFAKEPRENSARNVTSQVSEGLLQYLLLLFEVWTCLKRPEKFWASLGNQTFEILPKRDPRKVADTERKWHRSPTSSVFFV